MLLQAAGTLAESMASVRMPFPSSAPPTSASGKLHLKSMQGIANWTNDEAVEVIGRDGAMRTGGDYVRTRAGNVTEQ